MDEKEGWGLTEEEIKERLRTLNQEKAKRGPTRGGRSSGQGVKLLYIRDYLYAHATKEHPKNANCDRLRRYICGRQAFSAVSSIHRLYKSGWEPCLLLEVES